VLAVTGAWTPRVTSFDLSAFFGSFFGRNQKMNPACGDGTPLSKSILAQKGETKNFQPLNKDKGTSKNSP